MSLPKNNYPTFVSTMVSRISTPPSYHFNWKKEKRNHTPSSTLFFLLTPFLFLSTFSSLLYHSLNYFFSFPFSVNFYSNSRPTKHLILKKKSSESISKRVVWLMPWPKSWLVCTRSRRDQPMLWTTLKGTWVHQLALMSRHSKQNCLVWRKKTPSSEIRLRQHRMTTRKKIARAILFHWMFWSPSLSFKNKHAWLR